MTHLPAHLATLLHTHGYIPRDGSTNDKACEDLVRAHMAAAPVPTIPQLTQRITTITERDHVYPNWLTTITENVFGWVDPRVIEATPWRYTTDEMAAYAHGVAHDTDLMLKVARDLWIDLAQSPWPGHFRGTITTNGNHRAVVYHALGVPLIPAQISIETAEVFKVSPDDDNYLVYSLIDQGILTLHTDNPSGWDRISDPTGQWAWLSGARDLAARAQRVEDAFGQRFPDEIHHHITAFAERHQVRWLAPVPTFGGHTQDAGHRQPFWRSLWSWISGARP